MSLIPIASATGTHRSITPHVSPHPHPSCTWCSLVYPTRYAVLESKLHSKKIEEDAFDLHAEILEVIGGEDKAASIADAFSSRTSREKVGAADMNMNMNTIESPSHGDSKGEGAEVEMPLSAKLAAVAREDVGPGSGSFARRKTLREKLVKIDERSVRKRPSTYRKSGKIDERSMKKRPSTDRSSRSSRRNNDSDMSSTKVVPL